MTDRKNVSRALAGVLAALCGLAGCGGSTDDDQGGANSPAAAAAACDSVVDAYAQAWERCQRLSYDDAYDVFADAFECDEAKTYDEGQVAECVTAVNALTCDQVGQGTTPSSCGGLVPE